MAPARRLPALLALAVASLASCAAPAALGGATARASEAVVTFFLLVNRSGRDVRLRALADGRPLFVQDLPAQPEAGGGVRVQPAPAAQPTRELKVTLPPEIRMLEVQELHSGATARLDVGSPAPAQLGFRVLVDPDAIRVSRDYYPMR